LAQLANFQKKIEAGTILFKEGDKSDETYLLLRGEVEVLKGNKVVATISDSGTFFGEMGTLLNQPRSATIRTKIDSLIIVIKPVDFEKIIGAQPNIAFKLATVLATRLADTTQELIDLKNKVEAGNISSDQIKKENISTQDEEGEGKPEVDINALLEEALLEYTAKNLDVAINLFNKVLDVDPQNVEALTKISNAYYSSKNMDKAIEYMEKSVQAQPENPKIRNNLAIFYYKNGQKDEAVKEWEEVVRLDPNNQKAKNNLEKLKG